MYDLKTFAASRGLDINKFDPSQLAQWLAMFAAFLQQLFPRPVQATSSSRAGCCDHHACCMEVLKSALDTAAKAADHCQQCCDDTSAPCSDPVPLVTVTKTK